MDRKQKQTTPGRTKYGQKDHINNYHGVKVSCHRRKPPIHYICVIGTVKLRTCRIERVGGRVVELR